MKAIGYIRVSTEEQADSGLGLADQARKVRAAAELHGYDLVDILTDDGHSAKTLDRPGAAALLDLVDGGAVDCVIIAKLDRLTRSLRDIDNLLSTLARARRADGDKGVSLVSAGESIDTSTATGRMLVNIIITVAQWEREVISERTSAAMGECRRQGRSMGNAHYGYAVDADGAMQPLDREQRVLRIVEDRRSNGVSWSIIAASLNNQNMLNRAGSVWARQGVAQMWQRHQSLLTECARLRELWQAGRMDAGN